jgi:hypothetical protein
MTHCDKCPNELSEEDKKHNDRICGHCRRARERLRDEQDNRTPIKHVPLVPNDRRSN